jgi:hypothetical protein
MKDLGSIKPNTSEKKNTLPKILQSSGNMAEFGKNACISVGYFVIKGDVRNFRVTSFFGEEEDFEGFQSSIRQSFQSTTTYFVRP